MSGAASFSAGGVAFDPWQLDIAERCLWRRGTAHPLTPLQFAVLHLLVTNAGTPVSKQTLLRKVWGGVAVGDNSIERLMSDLRTLLDPDDRQKYIRTVPRLGYMFGAATSPIDADDTDFDVETLLEPFRACFEGRAALETLTRNEVLRARDIFERLTTQYPDRATYRLGLAIACVLSYESTRADPYPDRESLTMAAKSARKAIQLSPRSAEASATLGVTLERLGDRVGAIVALQRACSLEPDNWLHFCRLAAACWGEARLRAARRTLRLFAGFPMALWLAATVFVARNERGDAEREIDAALKSPRTSATEPARFLAVAIFYLKGLLCLARGAIDDALTAFDAELALETRGHFYARECCANVWYAKGGCFLRRGDLVAARDAFMRALDRVAEHPLAMAGLLIVERREGIGHLLVSPSSSLVAALNAPRGDGQALKFEHEMARAALLVEAGDVPGAVALLLAAIASAPAGNSGWLISLDPLLGVWEHPDAWEPVLQAIKERAL